MTLTGKWLKESGFKVGQVVDIHYKTNKLVITIAETQRFDLED
ncbi:SymE family type I addiction module toxin [Elizabethkingia meningoseptica]